MVTSRPIRHVHAFRPAPEGKGCPGGGGGGILINDEGPGSQGYGGGGYEDDAQSGVIIIEVV